MNRSARAVFLAAMLLGLFQESVLLALDPDRPLSHYPVKVWRSELRSRIIYHVRQSRDGYLWLATEDGLARFDGARVTYFDRASTREITHDYVSGIALSQDRGLIAGFGDGSILEAGPRGIHRLARTGGEGGSQPHSLLEDSRGRIWAGTDLGLFLLEAGRVKPLAPIHPLLSRLILTVFEDSVGRIWVGTDRGAGYFDTGGAFVPRPEVFDGGVRGITGGRAGLSGSARLRAASEDSKGKSAKSGAWPRALAMPMFPASVWTGAVPSGPEPCAVCTASGVDG